jgi:hypothetical protein
MVAGLASRPDSVVALAAVPGWRARPFPTRPSLSGACATILWSRSVPLRSAERRHVENCRTRIPTSTAERLACDARVQALLDDREGNRLYLSRARRLATPSQIAALTARDGEKCQFPGCTHTRYLHAHHVRHWLRGGPTDIDNLILVCSFHHQLIHDHGYTIRRLRGRWEFRRPDGTPLPTAPAPLSGRAEALIEANTRARLRIDQATLTPTWYGERLDPEPILDALLPRRITTAA